MKIIDEVLRRVHIAAPDGRPLHAYELTIEELSRLERVLRLWVDFDEKNSSLAQTFVLWAAERIRTAYAGGQLTWSFVFEGIGKPPPEYPFIKWLVRTGLAKWQRPLRRADGGHREFLYSLLAEGGLPDAALAESGRYRQVLLDLVAEIETEGALGQAMAETAAKRRLNELPQVLRSDDQARLMAGLAMELSNLRAKLPTEVSPESAERWLDSNEAGWRDQLPIRLSAQALEALIRPALAAERVKRAATPVRRELRRGDRGDWVGVATIVEDAILAFDLVATAPDRRLRLTTATGAAFLAQPAKTGWQLSRVSGSALMVLLPSDAVVLSAFADGQALGEVVLDAGMPSLGEAPSLWHASDVNATVPDTLTPLSGRGVTRAQQAWLLLDPGTFPVVSEGLVLGEPEPGPQGKLWPVSGMGRLIAGNLSWSLSTAAEGDAPQPHLVPVGRLLAGFDGPGGAPIFVGFPAVYGAEGDTPLRKLGSNLKLRPTRRTLGAQIAEWEEDGVVLARIRVLALPDGTKLGLTEVAAGRLRLQVESLPPRWHVTLTAGEVTTQAVVAGSGSTCLELEAERPPGLVCVKLSDPQNGLALELSAVWPAREALLIRPDGFRLSSNQEISLGRLEGWRGVLPGKGGSVALRGSKQHLKRIGFAASGDVRLASFAPVIGQALALAGPDQRVNLRLACGAGETYRLEIGRYDWRSEEAGPFQHLGAGRTWLSAVHLGDPSQTNEVEADGRIDLGGWLGSGDGLWFIQGRSDSAGVMRPLVWSAWTVARSTREERMNRFAQDWIALLDRPEDRAWDRMWALICAVRRAGDAGALDQVQALGLVPAAAVALLCSLPRTDRASALSLESEAPIWWPLVSCEDWAKGVAVAKDRIGAGLVAAGLEDAEATLASVMARIAGEVVSLRPELSTHLGQALDAAGLLAVATDSTGRMLPLAAPLSRLSAAAQEAARRFDRLPEGTKGLLAELLSPPEASNAINAELLHAPLVAAEVAAGLRSRKWDSEDVLRLIALRAADPTYFDAALPAALHAALLEASKRQGRSS